MRELKDLRWAPLWVSQLGSIKGCLEFLGYGITDGWLYGSTGHAFVLNIHDVVCPSGPTAWRNEVCLQLGQNLGFVTETVIGPSKERCLATTQELAWEFVKSRINQGLPCFGWEFEIPEYYVIYGYDDDGYFISGPGCRDGKGPRPWRELGRSEIGFVMVASLTPREKAEDEKAVGDALAFAVEYGCRPEKWTFSDYQGGLAAYRHWIRSLQSGTAIAMGLAYNAAVWSECRRFAVEFLKQAQGLVGHADGTSLAEAIECYGIVARCLDSVHQAYPFSPNLGTAPVEDDSRRGPAIDALTGAEDAEKRGLDALARVVKSLDRHDTNEMGGS